ncbi:Trafficking protein particle complex subunit 13 [Bagarius yarrelli]|uniref:Trafficking protein particle complex subunit 13 n=1 Tax=Bagarius yarrelli TaxID=175774 RepID=A0A556VXC4_BAGYA|nr:Trafficking protein particle complex subunit 13 [Bagarius yarrelli]
MTNIFLGETFSSYISVHNDSTQVVKDILVKVLKPLDVKTKFYNAETDEVFLEAQIQNITTSPMFMEKVSLEPSMMYNVTELNTVCSGEERQSTFGKMSYLQPMDTRQYLYCLKPKSEFAEKAGVIKGVTVIGKLDIVWKTNLGERGRLQTSQLQRMVHTHTHTHTAVHGSCAGFSFRGDISSYSRLQVMEMFDSRWSSFLIL